MDIPGDRLAFGGDYNPEQWDEPVWVEDIELMREAGVTMVTLGVFSWGSLELADGEFEFGWLDRVVELLHAGGIAIDLATPTASPPIWLHQAHREVIPVARDGLRYWQGGRLMWCPSSPVFRRYALRIVGKLAERYGDHPAVKLWHVGNELGGGNRHCYCDESAKAFRRWLTTRHGSVEALNRAWGTAFWGHRYGDFDQVLPPLDSESAQNPGLLLDFDRFSSDALLGHYLAEREVLRETGIPVTTNFMVGTGPDVVDYARWTPHVDLVTNDHYTRSDDPLRHVELAFAADRTRGLDTSRPWLLMEHSTSAVNWQSRNRSKEPGELVRNSLAHVARGSDGAMFFQWRASTAGAEQFHSAMVPHAGTRSKVWREVCGLGGLLTSLREVRGSSVKADVALLYDDEAGWAWSAGQKPHHDLPLPHAARDWHRAFWRHGVTVDVVPPWADLDAYAVIVVPALFLATDETAAALEAAAGRGATVIVTYLSGIVDETSRVRAGGYPGAFRDLLGVFVEEFFVLLDSEEVTLSDGSKAMNWTECAHADDAEVLVRFASGPLDGQPAVTRRAVGAGSAWYVAARLDDAGLDAVLGRLPLTPVVPPQDGLEAVRRVNESATYLFVLNHGGKELSVPAKGHDLVTGRAVAGTLRVPSGGVAVVRETSDD
jgi:beta-galactosidase